MLLIVVNLFHTIIVLLDISIMISVNSIMILEIGMDLETISKNKELSLITGITVLENSLGLIMMSLLP